MFLIDLAVPRDVEPRVESLDGVFLYNVDDLSKVVSESLASRAREAERAEAIVLEEALGWERWADAEQVTPAVVMLRERFSAVFRAELERSLRGRLKHLGSEERAALELMLDSALNKLLHSPTRRLRSVAAEHRLDADRVEQLVLSLDELFAVDEPGDAAAEDGDGDTVDSATEDAARRATGTESR